MASETEARAVLEKLDLEKLTQRPGGMPSGLMRRRITEDGFFQEGGLRFEQSDFFVGQLYSALAVMSRDIVQSGLSPGSQSFDRQ